MQPSPTYRNEEVNFPRLFTTLKRGALPILGATALAAAGAYLLAERQTPLYEAVSSVIAVNGNGGGNSVLNNSLVMAPSLPQGAVEQALHSSGVVEDVARRLSASNLPPATVAELQNKLRDELAKNSFSTIQVNAKTDAQQTGIYEILGFASSPTAASVLANAGVAALLQWDLGRAQAPLRKARANTERQLTALNARLAGNGLPLGGLERQSLVTTRTQLLQNLGQFDALGQASTGTLSVVGQAVEPSQALAPRPRRTALVAGIVALLAAIAGVLLLDALRRRIHGEQDLAALGVPLLSRVPRLRPRELKRGWIPAASGALHGSAGFLSLNVLSQLPAGQAPRHVVVSSARRGEGKSSVTMLLAAGLAASGKHVLIVDADLQGAMQSRLWGSAAPKVVRESVDGVQVKSAGERVDLVPVNAVMGGATRGAVSQLASAFRRWDTAYDVILIDTPPLLSSADAAALAAQADGMVLVVEAGVSSAADVESALATAQTAGARVIGTVLNKVGRREEVAYGDPGRPVLPSDLSTRETITP